MCSRRALDEPLCHSNTAAMTAIRKCMEALGTRKAELDAFFAEGGAGYRGYNEKMVADALHIEEVEVPKLIEWYARLELGEKIRNCVAEKGECTFEAEL
jgi:hypothetical protein